MSKLSNNLHRALATAVVTAAALTGNAFAAGCAGTKCSAKQTAAAKCGACKAKCGACKAKATKAKARPKAKCGAKCVAKCGAKSAACTAAKK